MKKILVIFGTRPEAIKMCPLINELKSRPKDFETVVLVTAQHREMLDQVLNIFNIKSDYDLNIMKKGQSLFDVTINILKEINHVLIKEEPDVVLVHGDTTTAYTAALAAFYLQIDVGHVEAGLRTYNIMSPYPEEFNRQGIDIISKYLFSPTIQSKNNLLKENKESKKIFVTGNTGIDALKTTISSSYQNQYLDWVSDSRLILVTAHRRENLGEPMRHMFRAIRRIVDEFNDVKVIYPIHLNPLVRSTAKNEFSGTDNIKLIEPLDVIDFHNFMKESYLVLTDSGGIQEEAPYLGKPVLVMRDTTERPEGIEAGTLKLVGTKEENIYTEFKNLLINKHAYDRMASASNPYGDGRASERIADILAGSSYKPFNC